MSKEEQINQEVARRSKKEGARRSKEGGRR